MKKAFYSLAVACMILPAMAFAQSGEETGAKSRSISKKIEINEENGVKTVSVETTEDGNTTKEIYTGKAAEDYLNREQGAHNGGQHQMMFKMDFSDSLAPFNFHMGNGINMLHCDSILKNFHLEFDGKMEGLEEEMKKLHEQMQNMKFDFNFNIDGFNMNDSIMKFENGLHKMIIIGDEDLDAQTKEELKKLGIDIDVQTNSSKNVTSKVIVARIVMIEDMEQDKKFKELEDVNIGFYPNPGNGDFTLEFTIEEEKDEAVISIHDLTGKIIYTETVKGKGDYKKQISLDEPSGVYIIKIQQGKKAITKKLIIQ